MQNGLKAAPADSITQKNILCGWRDAKLFSETMHGTDNQILTSFDMPILVPLMIADNSITFSVSSTSLGPSTLIYKCRVCFDSLSSSNIEIEYKNAEVMSDRKRRKILNQNFAKGIEGEKENSSETNISLHGV